MPEDNQSDKSFKGIVRKATHRLGRHENAILLIIFAGIIAVFGIISRGLTLRPNNIRNVFLQSSTRGIATIGQTLVILSAGIDVSVGGLALLVAVVTANNIQHYEGFPFGWLALSLLLALGIGTFNGTMVSRIGMPPLIVTLAVWQMTDGATFLVCRGASIRYLPRAINFLGAGEIAGLPVPVVIFIVVAVIFYYILYHTPYGRYLHAAGGNPVSALLAGIDVPKILFSVYIISAFLAAWAGIITMSRVMCAGMNTVVGLEIDSIASAAIGGVSLMGGRGTLIGAIIGALIIGVINNGMNVFAVDPAYQDIVKGAIIVVAVAIDYVRRRRG